MLFVYQQWFLHCNCTVGKKTADSNSEMWKWFLQSPAVCRARLVTWKHMQNTLKVHSESKLYVRLFLINKMKKRGEKNLNMCLLLEGKSVLSLLNILLNILSASILIVALAHVLVHWSGKHRHLCCFCSSSLLSQPHHCVSLYILMIVLTTRLSLYLTASNHQCLVQTWSRRWRLQSDEDFIHPWSGVVLKICCSHLFFFSPLFDLS